MRRLMLFLFATGLYLCVVLGVKAETISVNVEVTDPLQEKVETGSPAVLAASNSTSGLGGNVLDIKNVKLEGVAQGKNILAQLNLANLSGEDKLIDNVELIATRLDGTIVLTESIKTNEQLLPEKETTLDFGFPSELESGEYIGTVNIYSQGNLLGQSKTILSILPQNPEVLGATTTNYDYFPPLIAAIFAGVSILGFIILLKKRFLLQSKSLSLFDVIGVATAVSAIGFGLFVGYTLVQLLF
jgi:hypothetical protein